MGNRGWLVSRGGRWWWRGFQGPDGAGVRVVDAGVVWGGHDGVLLGVVVVLRRVGGAAVVATGAGAEGVSSREFRVGAGTLTRCGWFG